MQALPDLIFPRPRVLFVGINPGLRSAQIGHHFAGKGNPFWRLLHASGLTPVLLTAEEDGRLPEFGLALTNLCPRPSRTAAELGRAELTDGLFVLCNDIFAFLDVLGARKKLGTFQGGHRIAGGTGYARGASA